MGSFEFFFIVYKEWGLDFSVIGNNNYKDIRF